MKIFGFFYSEKVIFHKNKKNSIFAQYTLLGMTTEGFGMGQSHPDPACLFVSIPKLVSFKKLNRAGRRWENSQTRLVYILFLFLFFYFYFFIFALLFLLY